MCLNLIKESLAENDQVEVGYKILEIARDGFYCPFFDMELIMLGETYYDDNRDDIRAKDAMGDKITGFYKPGYHYFPNLLDAERKLRSFGEHYAIFKVEMRDITTKGFEFDDRCKFTVHVAKEMTVLEQIAR